MLDAYHIGVEKQGEEWMQQRMRTSARRLLTNIFRTGLFENPYLDPAHTSEVVGCPEFMQEGYDAQLKSVVMLKNHAGVLPLEGKKKVYIPERYVPSYIDFWGGRIEEQHITPLSKELVERYFELVSTPQEADAAIVFIESPNSGYGFDEEAARTGKDTGYRPISLQYSDYTATHARAQSLSGGDPYEDFTNRSYRGKSVKTVRRATGPGHPNKEEHGRKAGDCSHQCTESSCVKRNRALCRCIVLVVRRTASDDSGYDGRERGAFRFVTFPDAGRYENRRRTG